MNLTDKQIVELLRKKNVVVVKTGHKVICGRDTGIEAIIIGVEAKEDLSILHKEDVVPIFINSIPTDVQVVKRIRVLSPEAKVPERTDEWIPAPGGVSVGHPDITAGTLGMWAKRRSVWGVLSNNHVLGNINKGKIGDPIYQPGPVDGGTSKNTKAILKILPLISLVDTSDCKIANSLAKILNTIARLLGRKTRLVTEVAADLNLVDCAWAEALDEKFVDPKILGIGTPKGECELMVGDMVKKSGRSSEFNYGTVSSVDAAINVSMNDGRIGMFTDQVEFDTPGFIIPGDSGSVILNIDDKVGGLGFAGNEDRSYANKYHNVKKALELDTIGED